MFCLADLGPTPESSSVLCSQSSQSCVLAFLDICTWSRVSVKRCVGALGHTERVQAAHDAPYLCLNSPCAVLGLCQGSNGDDWGLCLSCRSCGLAFLMLVSHASRCPHISHSCLHGSHQGHVNTGQQTWLARAFLKACARRMGCQALSADMKGSGLHTRGLHHICT